MATYRIDPQQQYYRALVEVTGQDYGPTLILVTIKARSPDIVSPKYDTGDKVLCTKDAWIVTDTNNGQTSGVLLIESEISAKLIEVP